MKLLLMLSVCTCLGTGSVYAQEGETETELPPDPLLEEDVIGEPLSPEDFETAAQIADSEAIRLDDNTTKDPIENFGKNEGFFEGDIIIPGDDTPQRVAVRGQSKRWPSGQVPYYISSYFSSYERAVIAKAFLQYKKHTCIRMVPRTNQRNYVHVVKGGGCSSMVGRQGGAQRLTLGNGCVQVGVIVHEFLHAVGFWHEQSRPDRDSHVWIYWQNILSGVAYNFQAQPRNQVELMNHPYDLGSIMHYGKYAFSNGRGPTIVSKNGAAFGQRRGLSAIDIKKINYLYKCSGTVKPTVKPTKPGKGCVDSNQFCGDWSKKGECSKNAAYMKDYCKKSCGLCKAEECLDKNKFCGDWSKKGECKNNAAYMKIYCRKSCSLCEGTSKPLTKCTNDNKFCDDWSKLGQCQANAAYMKVSCKKACGLC